MHFPFYISLILFHCACMVAFSLPPSHRGEQVACRSNKFGLGPLKMKMGSVAAAAAAATAC